MSPAALGALLKGDVKNAAIASTPGGIEAQEAAGQRALVSHASRLPVIGTLDERYGREGTKREQWESVGFVFGDRFIGPDAIFVACTFPKGWSLKATEHSMWSDVLDDKGRKRASVFFKAAFYDYNAHTFGLECRYRIGATYSKDFRRLAATVEDTATGEVLNSIAIENDRDYDQVDRINKDAETWLNTNFSDWKNPLAYWA